MTRKYKILYRVFAILSFLAVWLPAIYFIIKAGVSGEIETNKVSFPASVMTAIILCVVSFVFKYHWRSPAVVLLFALYLVAENFSAVLLFVGIGIIFDELVFTPLCRKFKAQFIINKEIDKRGTKWMY